MRTKSSVGFAFLNRNSRLCKKCGRVAVKTAGMCGRCRAARSRACRVCNKPAPAGRAACNDCRDAVARWREVFRLSESRPPTFSWPPGHLERLAARAAAGLPLFAR